jgi:hypothetical protein
MALFGLTPNWLVQVAQILMVGREMAYLAHGLLAGKIAT